MTCNQMITLLQIYRGTIEDEMPIGTLKNDLYFLNERKLIVKAFVEHEVKGTRFRNWMSWRCTTEGREFVEEILK